MADHNTTRITIEREAALRARRFCLDCGIDVIDSGHYCLLRNPVWRKTGLGPLDGVLCVPCIEERLGRKLMPADFVTSRCKSDFPCWPKGELMLPKAYSQGQFILATPSGFDIAAWRQRRDAIKALQRNRERSGVDIAEKTR